MHFAITSAHWTTFSFFLFLFCFVLFCCLKQILSWHSFFVFLVFSSTVCDDYARHLCVTLIVFDCKRIRCTHKHTQHETKKTIVSADALFIKSAKVNFKMRCYIESFRGDVCLNISVCCRYMSILNKKYTTLRCLHFTFNNRIHRYGEI